MASSVALYGPPFLGLRFLAPEGTGAPWMARRHFLVETQSIVDLTSDVLLVENLANTAVARRVVKTVEPTREEM